MKKRELKGRGSYGGKQQRTQAQITLEDDIGGVEEEGVLGEY